MITKPTTYTAENVSKILDELLEILEKDEDLIFISELFKKRKISRQRFSEWEREFAWNREINEKVDSIKAEMEKRLMKWALKGKYNPATAIFLSKNYYWLKDKTEVENTHKVEGISKITLE